MKSTIVAIVLGVVVLLLLMGSTGCQTDIIGPAMSFKVLHKGENNNKEHLSRNAGMASRTGFHWGGETGVK
jgi:hypothetical protein